MARKFTFNLQKYLDYKESIVNGKAADLLKSKKLLDKENNKLEKLFDEKEIATLDYKKNKPSRILDLAIMSSYVNQISKNIDDKRATFRWASIENVRNLRLRFNHVICNPPFHSGRQKDIELLKSFIFYSSRLINPRGSVWMVFVSGVYLENELQNYFDNIKILYKDNHYFVCQLQKPKTER